MTASHPPWPCHRGFHALGQRISYGILLDIIDWVICCDFTRHQALFELTFSLFAILAGYGVRLSDLWRFLPTPTML